PRALRRERDALQPEHRLRDRRRRYHLSRHRGCARRLLPGTRGRQGQPHPCPAGRLMFDLDKWKEIWATLRSNRLRTFLTAFGVFWGILMLMSMLAFGSSIQTGSQRQMKGLATNMLFIWGQQTTMPYEGLPLNRWLQFKT